MDHIGHHYLGSTMSFIAVRSSPSITMSVNAGMHIKSTPLGATKPRAMATALIAWFNAPAPIACNSAAPRSRNTPASAPATEFGFDFAETFNTSMNWTSSGKLQLFRYLCIFTVLENHSTVEVKDFLLKHTEVALINTYSLH